jgi:ketosteroid isomerase-like protein
MSTRGHGRRGVASARAGESNLELQSQVRGTERAFAKAMATRDHAAFASFLSEETIFSGSSRVLRGKREVTEGWRPFFEGPQAPFSWEPDRVEVLDSGTLALSTGPVRDPAGKRIGTFSSVWRREGDGHWRIVLDNGCPPCSCP